MDWTNVRWIWLREARDQLRDRRTLFMVIVLPLLLYPVLGLGLVQLTLRFHEDVRTIGLVGTDRLPEAPSLLTEDGKLFHSSLFDDPGDQRLYVIDTSTEWSPNHVRQRKIDLLLTIPEGADERFAAGEMLTLDVYRDGTSDLSRRAAAGVVLVLERWEEQLTADRMQQLDRPAEFAKPLDVRTEGNDVSSPAERSGTLWGRFFPFLLVMMTLTGAFYPAIDMCAGEKERGTLETLLLTPVARTEIVLGKFLAILCFCVAVALSNLASMGLTFGQLSTLAPLESLQEGSRALTPPSPAAIAWMLVLMLPLAAFFSALSMALAAFARSMKEGQYYLMPLFLVVMPLVFLTLAPGVELDFFYSLIPVTNVALLLRALLLNQHQTALTYFLPVLCPTMLYAYMALRFAIRQFRREDVLFREAERFELRLWLRHLLRDKEPVPTGAQAWFCFLVLVALRWYGQMYLPAQTTDLDASTGFLIAQIINLIVFVALPPVLLAVFLTRLPATTLGLKVPLLVPSLIGLAMVITVHPVAMSLLTALEKVMPIAPRMEAQLAGLLDQPLWQKLIVLALLPAICEELAFRGYLLRGLLSSHSPAAAIALSSFLFGISHVFPQQMILATLLGVLLGILATRTGSIIPCIVFHALHNGLNITLAEFSTDASVSGYSQMWVIAGALGSAMLASTLLSFPNRLTRIPEEEAEADPEAPPEPLPA